VLFPVAIRALCERAVLTQDFGSSDLAIDATTLRLWHLYQNGILFEHAARSNITTEPAIYLDRTRRDHYDSSITAITQSITR
jgi:hypothetical protein